MTATPTPPSPDVPATFSGAPWPAWWRPLARRAWRRAEEHALRQRLARLEEQLARTIALLPTHSLALIETRARVEALIEINRDNPRRWKALGRLILAKRTALAPVIQQAHQAMARVTSDVPLPELVPTHVDVEPDEPPAAAEAQA